MSLYDRIPSRPYGTLTDAELDKWKRRKLSSVIAKRALKAAYDEENDPKTTIIDLLADLRHICDRLRFDFADLDSVAHSHYTEEVGMDRRRK